MVARNHRRERRNATSSTRRSHPLGSTPHLSSGRHDLRRKLNDDSSPPHFLCRLSPCVTVVEAAQAWLRNQRAIRGRHWLDRTSVGRVFAQRVVNAILEVIADIVADQTAKMLFIHRDDMVEDLAAAASDPSFGGSILPRCLNAGPFWLKSGGLQEANDIGVEDRVAIQNDVAIRSRLGKRFA